MKNMMFLMFASSLSLAACSNNQVAFGERQTTAGNYAKPGAAVTLEYAKVYLPNQGSYATLPITVTSQQAVDKLEIVIANHDGTLALTGNDLIRTVQNVTANQAITLNVPMVAKTANADTYFSVQVHTITQLATNAERESHRAFAVPVQIGTPPAQKSSTTQTPEGERLNEMTLPPQ